MGEELQIPISIFKSATAFKLFRLCMFTLLSRPYHFFLLVNIYCCISYMLSQVSLF